MSITLTYSSPGDNDPFYVSCVESCKSSNCTKDGKGFKEDKQPFILKMTLWYCNHECKHECMWKTVKIFNERFRKTPQFYGKWPFIRILGMQEPASVVFSLLNAFVHIKMMRKFRAKVKPGSPLFWLWHLFFVVCLHAWLWSAIFHYRDFVFTEFLDYACSFSLLLMNLYLVSIRLLHNKVSKYALIVITVAFIMFLTKHVAYLSKRPIDYDYNIKLNVAIGTISGLSWYIWCFYNRNRQKYVWKCAVYVTISGTALALELFDRPPYFYVLDYHSLWHLATTPLGLFMYRFGIDDCEFLRRQKLDGDSKKDFSYTGKHQV